MKIKRLDARFRGYQTYSYYVDLDVLTGNHKTNFEKFCEIREWCWEQWGPSREADWPGNSNPHWAWILDDYKMRLYLGGDNDHTLFALRWV